MDQDQESKVIAEAGTDGATTSAGENSGNAKLFESTVDGSPTRASNDSSLPKMSVEAVWPNVSQSTPTVTPQSAGKNPVTDIVAREAAQRTDVPVDAAGPFVNSQNQPSQQSMQFARALKEERQQQYAPETESRTASAVTESRIASGSSQAVPNSYTGFLQAAATSKFEKSEYLPEKTNSPTFLSPDYTSREKLERALSGGGVSYRQTDGGDYTRAVSRVSAGGDEFAPVNAINRRANIVNDLGSSSAYSDRMMFAAQANAYSDKLSDTKFGPQPQYPANNYYSERSFDRTGSLSTITSASFPSSYGEKDKSASPLFENARAGSYEGRLSDAASYPSARNELRAMSFEDRNQIVSAISAARAAEIQHPLKDVKEMYAQGFSSSSDFKVTGQTTAREYGMPRDFSPAGYQRDLMAQSLPIKNVIETRDFGVQPGPFAGKELAMQANRDLARELATQPGRELTARELATQPGREMIASRDLLPQQFKDARLPGEGPQPVDVARTFATAARLEMPPVTAAARPEINAGTPAVADARLRQDSNNDHDDFLRFQANPLLPQRAEVRPEVQQPVLPVARTMARISLEPVVEAQSLRPTAAKPEAAAAVTRSESGVAPLRALGLELTATARTTEVTPRVIETGRLTEGVRQTAITAGTVEIAAARVHPVTRAEVASATGDAALGNRVTAAAATDRTIFEGVRNVRTEAAVAAAGENGIRAGRIETALDIAGRPVRPEGSILSVRQESAQITEAGRTIRADLGQLTDGARPGRVDAVRGEGVIDANRVVRWEDAGVRGVVIDGRRIVEPVAPGKPVVQPEVDGFGGRRTATNSTSTVIATGAGEVVSGAEFLEDGGDDALELKDAGRLTADKRYLTGVELTLAALLTVAAAAKAREQDKDENQQPQVLHRRTYMMEQGDTLHSIAEKFYQDANLAPLIADFNIGAIKESFLDGKRIVEFKTRQLIELPEPSDIEEYRLSRKSGSADDLITIISESAVDQELLNDFLGAVSGEAPKAAKAPAAAETPVKQIEPAAVLPALCLSEAKALPAILKAAKPLPAMFARLTAKKEQQVV